MTHTYIQDITITLRHPDGSTIPLMGRNCGSDDDLHISFDDESGLATPIQCPPDQGQTYRSLLPLSDLDGKDGGGLWQLMVKDHASQDTGTLEAWTLRICAMIPADECDLPQDLDAQIPDGSYRYPDQILSQGTIPIAGTVHFQALNGISLQPGFTVTHGARFQADIGDCDE